MWAEEGLCLNTWWDKSFEQNQNVSRTHEQTQRTEISLTWSPQQFDPYGQNTLQGKIRKKQLLALATFI